MVPYHCLGSIWSQRDKKGKEHLAPTIRATVTQFNNVANCVITTCLGDRSMKASDRARVVEHWVEVARVCGGRSPGTPLCLISSRSVVWGLSPCADPGPRPQDHAGLESAWALLPPGPQACPQGLP